MKSNYIKMIELIVTSGSTTGKIASMLETLRALKDQYKAEIDYLRKRK